MQIKFKSESRKESGQSDKYYIKTLIFGPSIRDKFQVEDQNQPEAKPVGRPRKAILSFFNKREKNF